MFSENVLQRCPAGARALSGLGVQQEDYVLVLARAVEAVELFSWTASCKAKAVFLDKVQDIGSMARLFVELRPKLFVYDLEMFPKTGRLEKE